MIDINDLIHLECELDTIAAALDQLGITDAADQVRAASATLDAACLDFEFQYDMEDKFYFYGGFEK